MLSDNLIAGCRMCDVVEVRTKTGLQEFKKISMSYGFGTLYKELYAKFTEGSLVHVNLCSLKEKLSKISNYGALHNLSR